MKFRGTSFTDYTALSKLTRNYTGRELHELVNMARQESRLYLYNEHTPSIPPSNGLPSGISNGKQSDCENTDASTNALSLTLAHFETVLPRIKPVFL